MLEWAFMLEFDEEAFRDNLSKEKSVWIWEWKKKGNGDFFVVTQDDIVDYVAKIDYSEAVGYRE